MKNSRFIRQNSGMSLVETLVAGAVMMTVGLAILSLSNAQNRQVRSMSEKLNSLETEKLLQRVMAVDPFCNCWLIGRTLNLGTKTWTAALPNSIPLSYGGTCTPSGSLLAVGTTVPETSLRPTSIAMNDISEVVAGSGSYVGYLEVEWDPALLVQSIKGMRVPLSFVVDPATGAFQSCGQPLVGLGYYRWSASWGACRIVNPYTGACTCPPGSSPVNMGANDTHGWGGWVDDWLCK